jgi:GNAT superfamily N-acetyltransferase
MDIVAHTLRAGAGMAAGQIVENPVTFREIDDSRASLAALGRFYRERYVVEFPDADERESLANMRRYLALKAKGWYGPNSYHIVIAEAAGEPVGGVVFDYLAAPNCGVIEFLFVAAAQRVAGLGRALLDEAIRILRRDARERRGRRLGAIVAEMNDPFRRPATPDSLDPFCRATIWGKWGFGVLDFPYVQPALSRGQQSVDCLILIARPFGRLPASGVSAAWVKQVVAEYLRWAMRIDDPADNADYRRMAAFLDARRRIGLQPLQHYIGHDPQHEFEVEEVDCDDTGAEQADVEGFCEGGARSARDCADPPGGPAFDAAIALAREAIPYPGRVAAPAEFAAALAARDAGGPVYHLWALRAPGAATIDGMASFFTLRAAGFGGYLVLAGALRGRGLLPLVLARIEAQMMQDVRTADGWFIECGAESAAIFARAGFAEVPLDYRPPRVGDTAGTPRPPPERLHLLYKPFGAVHPPVTLETRFVLRALREILRGVYRVGRPGRHGCYHLAQRTLAADADDRVILHALPGPPRA